ncbi:related to DnaJ protein [Cephalotrichum gorgonifer]|uniref:Related to DnaJ protein n=1 Tax=Cephalotrichum gorgonifer TaxID=2041049 RepID=A0AAE8SXK9_9PEZI|nr:related to DnaJ protein [Cephalotrichum gorgonifer]
MSSPEDITDAEPPTIDPYEVLGLDRTATPDNIKTAYRKAALKNHPDKVPPSQREEAHTKFQSIAFAYAILSEPSRRARYDATGSTAESVDADDFNWSAYYRDLFADAISPDAIARFAEKYKRSEEERDHVLTAYVDAEGDMDGVYASVMLSDVLEDDERFREIIDSAIKEGEVESYDAYTKETKKKRKDRLRDAKAEANEAEEYAKELGVHDKLFGQGAGTKGKAGKKKKADNSEDALAALIKKNQQTRASFMDHLEEKYGAQSKSKKGKKRPVEDEPSEEAFQAAAARLKKGKAEAKAEAKADAGGSKKRTRR